MSSTRPSVTKALLHLRHLQRPTPTPSQKPTSTRTPQTELFPITGLIAATVTASVIDTGLIVYFKKHQR